VLSTAGARTLDRELPVAAANMAFDERGELRDPELGERLAEIVRELAAEAEGVPEPEPERIAA
jgi:ABC-type histidine transport system ATPase subunit